MYKVLALAFAAYFFSSSSFGAPRAQSAEECGIAADMALVAQSILDAACTSSGGNPDPVLGRSL